jgi:uncharacterized membrane protein (UPF0127 family)
VSSASADAAAPAACERLEALPAREFPGGLRIARAERRAERMRGLAKLDAMPAGYALHLPRCRSVHTFTMRFPLDLIWLDKHDRPVRVDRDVAPSRMRTCLRARSVIEANAGTADAFVTALGVRQRTGGASAVGR